VARLAAVLSLVWLAYVVLHTALSGRWWPMLLPDLVPPVLLVVAPVLLAALVALRGRPPLRTPRRWLPLAASALAFALGAGQSGLDLGALTRDLAGNTAPRLVAGDFNTTPAMGELNRLDRLLTRGRTTDGTLYPTSWNARHMGLWRLDFTYHDPTIRLHQYRFCDSRNLSDHDAQELWISTAKGQSA
jgi:endonuclease/exonuclease/phosphatase family metal-dependent hydrolase